MKRAYILFLILSLVATTFAEKKTTETQLKAIEGVGIGGPSETPEQVKQKAINNAKVKALQKAGIEEHINSYTDYFRSEANNNFQDLFTSDILSNINGTVKGIEVVEANLGVTPEGQLKYTVKINCTVIKYNTSTDKSFTAWIDGVKNIYKVGEGLGFTVKPTQQCYIRAFMFTSKSYILLPNDWEPSKLLEPMTEYKFPDEKVVDSYEMTLEDPNLDRETNRLVIVLLKQNLYYIGNVNYKDITDWIMSIPPDERMIESFAFDIYREK